MNKILIVDDDPTLVEFLKLLLDSEGYETADASNGEMALQQMASFQPEVVLLDYMMPNMDGLDVLRHISKNFEASFVVMLTGKGSEEVAVECMKAGAVDYVLKPFDNERLLGVLRNTLRYRETELQKRKLVTELQELRNILQRAADVAENLKQSAPAAQIKELQALLDAVRKKLA